MMRQPSILQSKSIRLVIIGSLLLIGIWGLALRPASSRLQSAADERTELIKQLQGNTEKKRLLAEAEKKYASLSSDLDKLRGVIPEASETGSFVSALEELAARAGVQIQSLTTKVQSKAAPRAATSSKTTSSANTRAESTANKTVEQVLLQSFYGTTVEVRLSGSYTSIRTFVQLIRQMERFVSITSINLSSNKQATDTSDILNSTISMSIFHRQAAKEANQ